MRRLIDADALTNKYGDWYVEEGTEEGFIGNLKQLIDSQPTIDAEPHWIPCSERLPEDGVYLVYAPEYRGGSSSSKEWHDDARFAICKNGKWNIEPVIAWMPLPEPYKVYQL